MYKFNSQSDPSMYFHIVVGTGSYTTSTTNMYNKDRFHVQMPVAVRQWLGKAEKSRGISVYYLVESI